MDRYSKVTGETPIAPECFHRRVTVKPKVSPGKARVRPQDDAHPRPGLADLRHDALDLLHRTRAAVDVGAPGPGGEPVAAAQDVERQGAVAMFASGYTAGNLEEVPGLPKDLALVSKPFTRKGPDRKR